MRPVIDFQHIFHGGDERRAGLGRNDELLFQVRFENVFFSVRPIVLSLTRSTIFSATTLSSSRRKVHRARPFGGSEQVRAISFASPAPSKMRGLAEAGECLRSSTASKPSSTNCRRVRAMVARPVFSAEAIRLSLQASPAGEASTFNRMRAFQLLRRVLAAVDQALQLFTLVRTELHNVLLYGDFPRDHEPAPTFIAKPSILTIYSLSMTQGTSV